MKPERDFLKTIHQIESSITGYEFKTATELIKSVPLDAIPNSHRPKMANLAKRLEIPQLGLKILWNGMYEQRQPSPIIQLEFASCLRKSGLCRQAQLWLNKLPTSDTTLRELAFTHIPLWEYSEAREILRDVYSRSSPNAPNDYAILKINLASCAIFLEDLDEALAHLNDLEANKGYGNQLIYRNSIELQAQCLIQKNQHAAACDRLESALSSEKYEATLTHLFLEKWRLLAQLAEARDKPMSREAAEIRALARKLRHWETLRDLDYQIALITNDLELMTKVYFGTPYASFKKRLLGKMKPGSMAADFVWRPSKAGPQFEVIDSYNGLGERLGLGQIEHRLMLLLLSDHYRPFSVAKIFDELYRDELYDPFTSDNRVHTLVKSLRKNLTEQQLPIEVTSTVAGYRLRPSDKVGFRVYPAMAFASINDFYKTIIQMAFGESSFSRPELESLLRLSPAQSQHRIKELVSGGYLRMQGKARATRYTVSM